MRDLIEKISREDRWADDEKTAERVRQELKAERFRRVHRATDEVYIDAGEDEASMTFDSKNNKAFVRMVITRETDATGKSVATLLKKHGMS